MALLSSSVIMDAVYMPDGSVTMTTIVMIIQMRGTAVSAYGFALLCTVLCSLATLAHGPISCISFNFNRVHISCCCYCCCWEGNWAEFTFAKTSGTLTGDRNNQKNRPIPLVPSKRVHETIKHVLKRCQTWRVLPPNIWISTAVKANCRAKGKLFICFWPALSALFRSSQLSGVFLAQKQHTCLPKVFLTSKNSCKEYFVERKQIKSTTAGYSKLRMFGGKTCHVCAQLEFVFSSCLDATDGTQVSLTFFL